MPNFGRPAAAQFAEEVAQRALLRAANISASARIQKLEARRDSLPTRLPLAEARKGQEVVKLSTERKHLTNILKMVAFQIESDLVEMIRPHYKRVQDEGRTLVQTILQDAADIEPTEGELRIPVQIATPVCDEPNLPLKHVQIPEHVEIENGPPFPKGKY